MKRFIERGLSYSKCLDTVRMKYGKQARVMNFRAVRIGGLFGGLFGRDGVEVTGYVSGRDLTMKEKGNVGRTVY